ncbi:Acyl-CoA dehydrogenase [Roseobacter sp. MED193]|uniref:acyl-CoA dehydrogenase family protein n=1 Tax=Roseobacter sp. MED193 TaxID=314262 RepID=UPI000068A369|nr:acyl-CoA dehydrogenase family protein [Roseobacter sp. MED193]EAQ44533.1 Acyl-CoA dehydrogenase [Roseobacter sp. MED193]
MTAHISPWMDDELIMLQDTLRDFYAKEMVPHEERWQQQGHIDRDFWNKAGEIGILCASAPEEYGGMGGDFRHEAVIATEQYRAAGFSGFGNSVHSQICAGYILDYGSEEQKMRWLPKMASGEMVCAIAMTEPSTGSDLQNIKTTARLEGNEYVLSGSKTFITNGQQADLIIVVAKTDTSLGAKGISLMMVETAEAEGFARGRNLEKLGLKSQDTSELFFDNVRLPPENLLGGTEGQGFYQLMKSLPQERLVVALGGAAAMEKALEETVAYTSERRAFGKPLLEMQNTRFKLAEVKTVAHIARVFLDDCVAKHLRGELDATTASMAKWWVTQMQCDTIDECLQLFGGYGYMSEYPISTMYADARVQKIYGGSNEIMKELIARSLTV